MTIALTVAGTVAACAAILLAHTIVSGAARERMTRRLLDRALERLPEDHRERYAQEWAADLAQLQPPAALLWALGLRRAARRLAATLEPGARGSFPLPLRSLPQAAFDLGALAAAYYLAYRLRFGATVPGAYRELLWHTVPVAAAGGVAVLAAFGIYRDGAAPLRICQAAFVAVLGVVGYAAVVHPTLVVTRTGFVPLMVPAGVLALFGALALGVLLASRGVVRVLVAVRSP
jgi:hypothetical protein